MLNVPAVFEKGFAIFAVEESDTPYFKFTGNGDSEAVAALGLFLDRVHDDMRTALHAQVAVDLTELYFMNSSCVRTFLGWIHAVKSDSFRYSITLQMNPRLKWQAGPFATLQRLAPTLVKVCEVTSTPPAAAFRAVGNQRAG